METQEPDLAHAMTIAELLDCSLDPRLAISLDKRRVYSEPIIVVRGPSGQRDLELTFSEWLGAMKVASQNGGNAHG